MLDQFLEAWNTNNRINLFLIDKISAPGMKSTLSKRGGRDVAAQFAHMHNNLVWHLERRAKDLAEGLVTRAIIEGASCSRSRSAATNSATRPPTRYGIGIGSSV